MDKFIFDNSTCGIKSPLVDPILFKAKTFPLTSLKTFNLLLSLTTK